MNDVVASQTPVDIAGRYPNLSFVIKKFINRIYTVSLVEVQSCTNSGGVATPGTVSVQILVNMINPADQPTPHGVIDNVPYFRYQAGASAIILDPQAGDVGIALFCMRDISNVKATGAQANPGSRRVYDPSDCLYIGGLFGDNAPTQYVRFSSSGIDIVSPDAISLQSPGPISIQGSHVTIQSTGGNTTIDGKPFLPHQHTGVQTGGGNSGPVL